MPRRIKDHFEIRDYSSLDELIGSLMALRKRLPADAEAEMKLRGDDVFGRALTIAQTVLSLLRNYDPFKAPAGFRLVDLLHKFDKQSGGQLGGRLGARDNENRKGDEWLLMFIAGMWFQDLWTYDFRRTEMCIIPYATQMGEISFCAYNTGVGWRQIVENMYQSAKIADWYKEHGKHAVYANPKKAVPLPSNARPVALHIPKDGRLVEWAPTQAAATATASSPVWRCRSA